MTTRIPVPPLSPSLAAAIAELRRGPPSDLAPETYGLDRFLGSLEPSIALELLGNCADSSPVERLSRGTPQRVEVSCQASFRTLCLPACEVRPQRQIYAIIGYDWVNWEWLEPGESTGTLSAGLRARVAQLPAHLAYISQRISEIRDGLVRNFPSSPCCSRDEARSTNMAYAQALSAAFNRTLIDLAEADRALVAPLFAIVVRLTDPRVGPPLAE